MREVLVKGEEFKDSPVGRIPKDWEINTIGEQAFINSGTTPSRSVAVYWENGTIAWVKTGEVNYTVIKNTEEKITQKALNETSLTVYPIGTVLVAMYGQGLTRGKVGILGIEATTNQACAAIIPKNENLISTYLFHYLSYHYQDIRSISHGSNQSNLSESLIASFQIRLPPREEQQRIAEILDTVDDAIAHTSSLITKLKQIKAGLLHDLLTRGLDENGQLRDAEAHPEEFKDSALGRIPKDWHIHTIGDLVESAIDGPFGSNLKTEHYVNQPEVRVVRLQNIENGYFDDSDKAYVSYNHASKLHRHEVVGGDLIVACLGDENHPIARACLYPADAKPGIVKADCFRLRFHPSMAIHAYVMYVLNCSSTRGDINLLGQGVTRDRVNLTTLLKVRVRIPPVREQNHIVAIIDSHDTRIRKEEAYLNKLKLQKQGLMHDLLTGKVRVNNIKESDEKNYLAPLTTK